ncbi:MAG TPA: sulfite exporter TauE/SafE family protein [Candidatus Paceibacterota bacterium]|nr:sulfite exporter TauE/SafE family protein [Candidatus Paceibacterota bacterium]
MITILSIVIGIVSGMFSGFIGGGAGLIAVPFLMFIGVPPYSAVTTPKFGAFGIALGSLTKFSKTNYIQWKLIPWFLIVAVLAAVTGANLLLKTPEYILKYIVGVLLLITAVTLYTNKSLGIISTVTSKVKKAFGFICYFLTEGLRAAFGSGFGTITSLVLMYFFGMTMLESSATKRLAGVVVTFIAFLVFVQKGLIDFRAGIGLFIGMIIGGYLGTKWAIKVGDKWLKYIFTAFAIIASILLFSGVDVLLL